MHKLLTRECDRRHLAAGQDQCMTMAPPPVWHMYMNIYTHICTCIYIHTYVYTHVVDYRFSSNLQIDIYHRFSSILTKYVSHKICFHVYTSFVWSSQWQFCSVLHTVRHCNSLQHTATHCNTHCNTLHIFRMIESVAICTLLCIIDSVSIWQNRFLTRKVSVYTHILYHRFSSNLQIDTAQHSYGVATVSRID